MEFWELLETETVLEAPPRGCTSPAPASQASACGTKSIKSSKCRFGIAADLSKTPNQLSKAPSFDCDGEMAPWRCSHDYELHTAAV